MFLARLAAVLLCLSVTLGQRVQIGGAGGLDPFMVAFVVAAAALWVHDELVGAPRSPYKAVALNTVGPLLALMFLFPLLGVLFGDFAITTLAGWILPAFIMAVLSLARAQRLHGIRLAQYGYALVLIEGIYGLGQTANRLGLMPGGVWAWAANWDFATYMAYSDDPGAHRFFVYSRSMGLFVNANQFGLWSVLALVFAATYLKGRQRTIATILGVLGVVGSQSRTAWAVLALLAAFVALRALRDQRVAGRVVGWLVALLPVVAIGALFGWLPRLVESQLLTRLASGLDVIGGGVEADQNLKGRYEAWARAIDFSREYPFGTFGLPGQVFGGFIDNQYVTLFLQGSVLLVAAYALALLSPLVLARRGVPNAGALGVASFVFAVFSITMHPLGALGASSLVWLMAAMSLGQPSVSHETSRAAGHRPRGTSLRP